MQLIELLKDIDRCESDNAAIYVVLPWSCEADAFLLSPAPDTAEPIIRGGLEYSYFLETFIVREFLDDYAASVEGARASEEQRCERLMAYARNDA